MFMSRHNKEKLLLIFLMFSCFYSGSVPGKLHAQVAHSFKPMPVDAISWGASNAFSMSHELLTHSYAVAVEIPGLSAEAQSNVLSLKLLQDDFSKDAAGNAPYLDDAEKNRILDLFSGGKGIMQFTSTLHVFTMGVRISQLALVGGVEDRLFASVSVPRDFPELVFFGNAPGHTYRFDDAQAIATWLRQYSLASAKEFLLPKGNVLRVYGRASFLQGIGLARVMAESMQVFTADSDYSIQASGHLKMMQTSNISFPGRPRGFGWGIDLLGEFLMPNGIQISAGVVDLGSLTWTKDVEGRNVDGSFLLTEVTSSQQRQSFDSAFQVSTPYGTSSRIAMPARLLLQVGYYLDASSRTRWLPGIIGARGGLSQTLTGSPLIPKQLSLYALLDYSPASWLRLGVGPFYGTVGRFGMSSLIELESKTFHFQIGSKNVLGLFGLPSATNASLVTSLFLTF